VPLLENVLKATNSLQVKKRALRARLERPARGAPGSSATPREAATRIFRWKPFAT
jgi:hypothetical protein